MATTPQVRLRQRFLRQFVFVLFVGSFFVVKPLWRAFGVSGPERLLFLLIPLAAMGLFVLTILAATGCDEPVRPAGRRYVLRLMGCIALSFVLMALASLARDPLGWSGWPLLLVSFLPALPILGCVLTMGAYLVEEQDEYLRMRSARASLIGTGILLCVATVWGFLEQMALVPHQPASLAFPVWAAGLGVGQMILKVRS